MRCGVLHLAPSSGYHEHLWSWLSLLLLDCQLKWEEPAENETFGASPSASKHDGQSFSLTLFQLIPPSGVGRTHGLQGSWLTESSILGDYSAAVPSLMAGWAHACLGAEPTGHAEGGSRASREGGRQASLLCPACQGVACQYH